MAETPALKIAIFIPAYNAAYTLPVVLDRIPAEIKEKVKEIFVIDNASPDNTHLIGIGYRETRGLDKLEVFRNETNRGYGGSQKLAYRYAIDNGFDIVVMERTPVIASNNRGCIAFVKSGLYLGMWKDTTNRVSIRNELSSEPYDLYTQYSYGATRTQLGKVVQIVCYDTIGADITP